MLVFLFFFFFVCVFFFFFKQKTAYEIGVRLVGSEMCIRDRAVGADLGGRLCGGLVLGFLLAEQGVEGLQDQEQHERHDEEVAGTQEVSFGFAQT